MADPNVSAPLTMPVSDGTFVALVDSDEKSDYYAILLDTTDCNPDGEATVELYAEGGVLVSLQSCRGGSVQWLPFSVTLPSFIENPNIPVRAPLARSGGTIWTCALRSKNLRGNVRTTICGYSFSGQPADQILQAEFTPTRSFAVVGTFNGGFQYYDVSLGRIPIDGLEVRLVARVGTLRAVVATTRLFPGIATAGVIGLDIAFLYAFQQLGGFGFPVIDIEVASLGALPVTASCFLYATGYTAMGPVGLNAGGGTLAGDVVGPLASNVVEKLTGTGAAVQVVASQIAWQEGVRTPEITQAIATQQYSPGAADLTVRPQRPYASAPVGGGTPGSFVADVGEPVQAGDGYAGLVLAREGVVKARLDSELGLVRAGDPSGFVATVGPVPGKTGDAAAVWLLGGGTDTLQTNYALQFDDVEGALSVNAPFASAPVQVRFANGPARVAFSQPSNKITSYFRFAFDAEAPTASITHDPPTAPGAGAQLLVQAQQGGLGGAGDGGILRLAGGNAGGGPNAGRVEIFSGDDEVARFTYQGGNRRIIMGGTAMAVLFSGLTLTYGDSGNVGTEIIAGTTPGGAGRNIDLLAGFGVPGQTYGRIAASLSSVPGTPIFEVAQVQALPGFLFGRRVIAMGLFAPVSDTNVPAGDGVLFLANALVPPDGAAGPSGGVVLYAQNGAFAHRTAGTANRILWNLTPANLSAFGSVPVPPSAAEFMQVTYNGTLRNIALYVPAPP